MVLGSEIGGCCNAEALRFVQDFVCLRSYRAPRTAWTRRWRCQLSVAVHGYSSVDVSCFGMQNRRRRIAQNCRRDVRRLSGACFTTLLVRKGSHQVLPVAASDSSCLVLLRLSPSRGPQGSFVGTCFATLPHDKGIIQCSLLLQLVQNGGASSCSVPLLLSPSSGQPRMRTKCTQLLRSRCSGTVTPAARCCARRRRKEAASVLLRSRLRRAGHFWRSGVQGAFDAFWAASCTAAAGQVSVPGRAEPDRTG